MKYRNLALLLLFILLSMTISQGSAVRYSPGDLYIVDFEEDRPFATFRESSMVTNPLHLEYFTIFEMRLVSGNYDFSDNMYQISKQQFELDETQQPDHILLNYTTTLPNEAQLSIAYYLYSTDTSTTLGNRSYDVDQSIIRASYSVSNWTFDHSDAYLSIHTNAHRERDGSGGGGGANRTGWYMNMDSMMFSAKTMHQYSDGDSIYPDGDGDDEVKGTADPSIGTGGGSNETHEFQDNGVGLLPFDSWAQTDVFYSISVNYDPSTTNPLGFALVSSTLLPLLALAVILRRR